MAIFSELNAIPIEFYNIKPLWISAPISQMQFHHRSIKDDAPEKNNEDYMKVKPKSFQTYFYNTEQKMPQKNLRNFDSIQNEDSLALPSSFYYNVYHPRTRSAKPKSLQITFDPKLGEVTKLDMKDTFLDSLQPKASTEKPKLTTTTKKVIIRRPTTRRPPKPQPKIKSPSIDQQPTFTIEENNSSTAEKPIVSNMPYGQQTSNLAGQSQIGNRESQMVIKPTVIVNIRGTVSNHDSEIKLESRNIDGNVYNMTRLPYGIFNINQEINIDKTFRMPSDDDEKKILRSSKKIYPIDSVESESLFSEEKSENLSENTTEKDKESDVLITEIRHSRSDKFDNLNNDQKHQSNRMPRKIFIFEIGPLGGFKNV